MFTGASFHYGALFFYNIMYCGFYYLNCVLLNVQRLCFNQNN